MLISSHTRASFITLGYLYSREGIGSIMSGVGFRLVKTSIANNKSSSLFLTCRNESERLMIFWITSVSAGQLVKGSFHFDKMALIARNISLQSFSTVPFARWQ